MGDSKYTYFSNLNKFSYFIFYGHNYETRLSILLYIKQHQSFNDVIYQNNLTVCILYIIKLTKLIYFVLYHFDVFNTINPINIL